MAQVQISVQENEGSWKQRCYPRLERLKWKDYHSYSTLSEVQPEFITIMKMEGIITDYSTTLELQKAVKNGDVDNFVDTLEKVCSETKSDLSYIIDRVTPAGDSLLHEAAYFGRTNIAELIGHHFPGLLTKTNMKGDTPLHVAARATRSEVIKVILRLSATTSEGDDHEFEIPTIPAFSWENMEYERITTLENEYGNTALHEAVCSNDLDGVTLLFEEDKRATHCLNKSGISPLYLAVLTGNKKIVDVLLEASIDRLPSCYGISPLHAAVFAKNAALIKEILAEKGELIHVRDENGGTPLHFAAAKGFVEGVRFLLENSAQAAFQSDRKGHLPIHLACKHGHLKVVKEFLKLEWADDSRVFVNKKGQNILHIAAKNGRHYVVNYLLRNSKHDVNEKDKNGNTPLHLAAQYSFLKVLFCLTRDKKIDVNLMNNKGYTALDICHQNITEAPNRFQRGISRTILCSVGARERRMPPTSVPAKSLHEALKNWKETSNTLIVVAILIVTVTFAAGFTVPGGVYSSEDGNNKGMAVLGNRTMFKIFVIFNTVAMLSSTIGTALLMWTQNDFLWALRTLVLSLRMVGLALVTMSIAFVAAVRLVVTNVSWLANLITVFGFLFVFFIFILCIVPSWRIDSVGPVLGRVTNFVIWMLVLVYGSSEDVIKAKESLKYKKYASKKKKHRKGKHVAIAQRKGPGQPRTPKGEDEPKPEPGPGQPSTPKDENEPEPEPNQATL